MAKAKRPFPPAIPGQDDKRKYLGPGPNVKGVLVLDVLNGQTRIRKWPRKRPGKRHPTSEFWSEWLRQGNRLYKHMAAHIQHQFQELTAGTMLMPRDLLFMLSRGTMGTIILSDGTTEWPTWWYHKMSDALDVFSDTPGAILVRTPDGWAALTPAEAGEVLTSQGTDDIPNWAPPTGGGGGGGADLLQTWTHDGSTNPSHVEFTDINQNYDDLILELRASSDRDTGAAIDDVQMQFGHPSYDTGNNYSWMQAHGDDALNQGGQQLNTDSIRIGWASTLEISQDHCHTTVTIRDYAQPDRWTIGQSDSHHATTQDTTLGRWCFSWLNDTDALTHIRLYPLNGSTWTSGKIRLFGRSY